MHRLMQVLELVHGIPSLVGRKLRQTMVSQATSSRNSRTRFDPVGETTAQRLWMVTPSGSPASILPATAAILTGVVHSLPVEPVITCSVPAAAQTMDLVHGLRLP